MEKLGVNIHLRQRKMPYKKFYKRALMQMVKKLTFKYHNPYIYI